jgi:hypothetical protein
VVDKQTVAALRAMPKRDNAGYHEAMKEARQAYELAEQFFAGASFSVTTKTTGVTSEAVTVTWTFKRDTDDQRANEDVSGPV